MEHFCGSARNTSMPKRRYQESQYRAKSNDRTAAKAMNCLGRFRSSFCHFQD